jgi:hypothetical protein
VLNIIWVMVAGERYNYTDPQMKEIIMMVTDVTASLAPKPSIGFVFPLLREIFPSVDYVKDKGTKISHIKSFLKTAIEQHKKDFDESFSRDFIDAYIKEIKVTVRRYS